MSKSKRKIVFLALWLLISVAFVFIHEKSENVQAQSTTQISWSCNKGDGKTYFSRSVPQQKTPFGVCEQLSDTDGLYKGSIYGKKYAFKGSGSIAVESGLSVQDQTRKIFDAIFVNPYPFKLKWDDKPGKIKVWAPGWRRWATDFDDFYFVQYVSADGRWAQVDGFCLKEWGCLARKWGKGLWTASDGGGGGGGGGGTTPPLPTNPKLDLGVNNQQIGALYTEPLTDGTVMINKGGLAKLTWWSKDLKSGSCVADSSPLIKSVGGKTWKGSVPLNHITASDTYKFKVFEKTIFSISCKGKDNSAKTDNVTVDVQSGLLNLNASSDTCANGEPNVKLSWNEVANATSYKVYRDDAPLYPTTPGLSYTDTTASDNATHIYNVEALQINNSLARSNTVTISLSCAQQPAYVPLPNPPRNLAAESVCSERKVVLTWKEPSGGGSYDAYNVYRWEGNNTQKTKIYSTAQKSYSYIVTEGEKTKPYSYCVTAYNSQSNKESSCSNTIAKRACPFSVQEILPQ